MAGKLNLTDHQKSPCTLEYHIGILWVGKNRLREVARVPGQRGCESGSSDFGRRELVAETVDQFCRLKPTQDIMEESLSSLPFFDTCCFDQTWRKSATLGEASKPIEIKRASILGIDGLIQSCWYQRLAMMVLRTRTRRQYRARTISEGKAARVRPKIENILSLVESTGIYSTLYVTEESNSKDVSITNIPVRLQCYLL